MRSKKTWDSGGPVDMDIGAINTGKGKPKGKGKNRGKGKDDKGKGQPKGKSQGKGREPGHFAKDCDHRVRTVNEINQTVPVSTTS